MSDVSNDTTSGTLVEDILLSRNLTAQFVSALGEPHLVFFLPLILDAIQQSKPTSPLLEPLRQRICASRRVKLRFLLLRKHPAFSSLPTKITYSSRAYGVASIIGTRILSPSCSGYLDERQSRIKLKIPVDMVDLQSEDFFRTLIFRPASDKTTLGMQMLSHPFYSNQFSNDIFSDEFSLSSRELVEDFIYEDDTFQTARLRKISGQRVVELLRVKLEAEEIRESNLEILLPKLILRESQDVLIMQATQMLFYFLNHVWARTSAKYEDADAAPLCITFDAVATHAEKGILQTFNRVQSFLTFSFDFWRDTRGQDPTVVDHFVRSAAGAFTAGYIIGMDYRNGSEVCVKDGNAVFMRDTEGVFESIGPRIYIPKAMRECFRAMQVWDDFRVCCIRAFNVARASYGEVFPIITGLYSQCGVSESKISQYLHGKHSLNLAQKEGIRADGEFRKWLG